jgi:hypothetical protein
VVDGEGGLLEVDLVSPQVPGLGPKAKTPQRVAVAVGLKHLYVFLEAEDAEGYVFCRQTCILPCKFLGTKLSILYPVL